MFRPSWLGCAPVLLVLCCTATRVPGRGGAAAQAGTAVGAALPGAPAASFRGAGTPVAIPSDVAFVSLEGPFWVAGTVGDSAVQGPHGYLLFSDVVETNGPGAAIYKFEPVARRFSVLPYPGVVPAGPTSTNGLAVNASGELLACERYNGRLVRVSAGLAGSRALSADRLTVMADGWPAGNVGQGTPPARRSFNAPNDLVISRDGNVYFTDSDWGARPGPGHAPMGVYRVSPGGQVDRVLDLEKPNGIALSPDQRTLYVGSDVQAKVWRLPLDAAGAAGPPTLFIDGAQVAGGFKVPDGICIDDTGNLYVTNNADDVKAIVVFDNTGRSLGRIPFPQAPSNCTFGGPDRRTLYATTLHAIYEVPMATPGLP